MAIAIGINAEVAIAEEVTYGSSTGIGAKQYFDAVSEGVVLENPNIVSSRLRGGRLPTASALVKGGRKRVTGNLELEVQTQSIGWFLKHLLGSVSTTGSVVPYTHTFTLGNLPIGLHTFVKRDTTVFTYKGCRINTTEFSVSDQMLRATVGILGQDATTGDAFAGTPYPVDNDFFAFHEGKLYLDNDGTPTVATAAEVDVREVSVSFDNQLIEMPKLGSRLNRQPIQGRSVITGRIRKEFEEPDSYTRFLNGEPASLKLAFTGVSSRSLTFNFERIFYTGATPTVGSPEPIGQELPFEVRDDGTANGGITVVLVNDTAAY